ncbi:MAG TPA: ABC transporter substrate-binding protein [Pirellulales bacterium]|nr:ABC transporter substrate-binding protein [Pirellulales bacterium]
MIVPDPDNLQFMSFWVAKGAGYFADQGIELELLVPDEPRGAQRMVLAAEADCAVLPPPMYLELIAERFPWALVANLLENDAINLVVRRSLAVERHLDPTAPLKERLIGLAGVRIGIAPNPPTRLRALFASVGLDADRDVKMVIFRGNEQNEAFGDGRVDALYAHTPYLEKALVDQDAIMLVDQSKGEAAKLAVRQIHALAVSRRLITEHKDTVQSLVQGISKAQQLIHRDQRAAVQAILHEFPDMDERHVVKVVEIYEPAIPRTPRVSADGFQAALDLFPASRKRPDLTGIDLTEFVAPGFAESAEKAGREPSAR